MNAEMQTRLDVYLNTLKGSIESVIHKNDDLFMRFKTRCMDVDKKFDQYIEKINENRDRSLKNLEKFNMCLDEIALVKAHVDLKQQDESDKHLQLQGNIDRLTEIVDGQNKGQCGIL